MKIYFIFLLKIKILSLSLYAKEMEKEPSKASWEKFQKNISWRENFWQQESSIWDNWHWSYRQGWVDLCYKNPTDKICEKVWPKALHDKALIIRESAVRWLRDCYKDHEEERVVVELQKIFQKERKNKQRNQNLLKEILYTLWCRGTRKSLETGDKLSKKYDFTEKYWSVLTA